jgi:8-oxo-dGTP pyrophosphatase MutT (NUDIX family)
MGKSKITRVGFLLYDPNENVVLIHKRDDKKGVDSRGMWDYFGGSLDSIDLGNVKYALDRELYEELGVSVDRETIFSFPEKNANGNEKMFYILFPKYKTHEFKLGEGSGFAWVSFEEVFNLIKKLNGDQKIITLDLIKYLKQLKDVVTPIYNKSVVDKS